MTEPEPNEGEINAIASRFDTCMDLSFTVGIAGVIGAVGTLAAGLSDLEEKYYADMSEMLSAVGDEIEALDGLGPRMSEDVRTIVEAAQDLSSALAPGLSQEELDGLTATYQGATAESSARIGEWSESNCVLLRDDVCGADGPQPEIDPEVEPGRYYVESFRSSREALEATGCKPAMDSSRPRATQTPPSTSAGPDCYEEGPGVIGPSGLREQLVELTENATGYAWEFVDLACSSPDLVVGSASVPSPEDLTTAAGLAYFVKVGGSWEFRGINASFDRQDSYVVDLNDEELDRAKQALAS